MNRLLTKSFLAGAAIPANTLVKFSADNTVVPAAAATDLIIGVSSELPTDSGAMCDVVMAGIADVKAGGAITRGVLVTSDASGEGVAAAPAAGVNNRVLGPALVTAADGDIVPVLVMPHQIQGA